MINYQYLHSGIAKMQVIFCIWMYYCNYNILNHCTMGNGLKPPLVFAIPAKPN